MSPDDEFGNPRPKPRPQPEVDRGGSGRPPRKTAIGYFDDPDDDESFKRRDNFKKYQKVKVVILGQLIGGYMVKVVGMDVTGTLKTERRFSEDLRVEAVFWEWTLNGTPIFILSENEMADVVKGVPKLKQIDFSKDLERKFKFKRRTDILPMPVEALIEKIDFEEINIRKFLKSLNDEAFNGFVLFSSQQLLSRGYLLMHKGLSVGCDYASASQDYDFPVEQSIKLMLEDFVAEDAIVLKCPRQPEIVLAISAAFMGVQIPWEYEVPDAQTLLLVMDWFKYGNEKTGFIQISSDLGSCFAYFYKSQFQGCFQTESQTFEQDEKEIFAFLSDSLEPSIQIYTL